MEKSKDQNQNQMKNEKSESKSNEISENQNQSATSDDFIIKLEKIMKDKLQENFRPKILQWHASEGNRKIINFRKFFVYAESDHKNIQQYVSPLESKNTGIACP